MVSYKEMMALVKEYGELRYSQGRLDMAEPIGDLYRPKWNDERRLNQRAQTAALRKIEEALVSDE